MPKPSAKPILDNPDLPDLPGLPGWMTSIEPKQMRNQVDHAVVSLHSNPYIPVVTAWRGSPETMRCLEDIAYAKTQDRDWLISKMPVLCMILTNSVGNAEWTAFLLAYLAIFDSLEELAAT